jgi:hypothetical protein
VVLTARSGALRTALPIRIIPQKTRMALYRIPPFIPFPTDHAGSCLVDHRAMPPLTTTPSSDSESRGNGTRKLC